MFRIVQRTPKYTGVGTTDANKWAVGRDNGAGWMVCPVFLLYWLCFFIVCVFQVSEVPVVQTYYVFLDRAWAHCNALTPNFYVSPR